MRSGLGIGIGLIVGLIIALSPALANAHPGKTDVRGGHKCWKGCRQWELYHGEYHLHDKDFRPIRISEQKIESVTEVAEPAEVQPAAEEKPPERPPVPEVQPLTGRVMRQPEAAAPPAEESSFLLNPYAIALLALLLVLMLMLLAVGKRGRRH